MRRIPRVYDHRLEPSHSFFQSVHTLERRRQSHSEHGDILNAMIHRQGARADSLMREHVYRNREAMRAALRAWEEKGEETGEEP